MISAGPEAAPPFAGEPPFSYLQNYIIENLREDVDKQIEAVA
jgi:hypothetical protein